VTATACGRARACFIARFLPPAAVVVLCPTLLTSFFFFLGSLDHEQFFNLPPSPQFLLAALFSEASVSVTFMLMTNRQRLFCSLKLHIVSLVRLRKGSPSH
jgi:hypothetical protein